MTRRGLCAWIVLPSPLCFPPGQTHEPLFSSQTDAFCPKRAASREIEPISRAETIFPPSQQRIQTQWRTRFGGSSLWRKKGGIRPTGTISREVMRCTTTDQPYVSYDLLRKGAFISNISLMDVHKDIFTRADKVVVDDWMQCNREGKVLNLLVEEGLFSFEQIHAELGDLVSGRRPGREADEEIILFNPMGLAIEDIACAQAIYQRAREKNIGTWLSLY